MSALKNGLVRVSCEFLTEVIIQTTESRVPPDSIATGVYYDPSDDSFVFIIASELLPERKELEPLKEVAQVKTEDIGRFFQGLTGRTWGVPMTENDLSKIARDAIQDFHDGHADEKELLTALKFIADRYEGG